MSTATVPPPIVGRATTAPSRATGSRDVGPAIRRGRPAPMPAVGDSSAARTFLHRYTGTLLTLVAALAALQVGWQQLADSTGTVGPPWLPVGVAACGWALGVAAWLHHRGWPTGTVAAVIATPAAVLAAPAAAGWLSPAGLVLWGSMSTVLAVALSLAAQPVGTARPTTDRDGSEQASDQRTGFPDHRTRNA
jgi:hypothetical protein